MYNQADYKAIHTQKGFGVCGHTHKESVVVPDLTTVRWKAEYFAKRLNQYHAELDTVKGLKES